MTQMSLSNLSQSIAQNQQQAALLQKHQQLSNLAAHQQQAAAANAGSPFYQSPQKLNMAAASINHSVQNLQAQQARAKSLNLGFTTGAMNQQQQQVGQASQQSNYMQMNNMQQNIDSQRQISQQMQQQQQVKNSPSAPSPSQPNQKLTVNFYILSNDFFSNHYTTCCILSYDIFKKLFAFFKISSHYLKFLVFIYLRFCILS